MANALINVPKRARRGEIIEIRTLISHGMESGFRRMQTGAVIPRDILRLFVCTYNGVEIFRMKMSSATAANPFVSFFTTATETGTLFFRWTGDEGFKVEETASITVA